MPIPRPEFSFKGAWFKVGYEQEVHLIAGLQSTVNSGSRGNHVAFEVCNIFDFEKHLIAKNYEYQTLKQRSDKSWQLFLKDPDGYYIEMFQVHKITI